VTTSTGHPPGLRVWRWERELLAAFVSAVVAIAAVFLASGFLLKGSAQIILFIVGGLLAVCSLTLLCVAANRNTIPVIPEKTSESITSEAETDQKSSFVDDPSKVLSEDLDSIAREKTPSAGEAGQ
jgi:hypothetical protein